MATFEMRQNAADRMMSDYRESQAQEWIKNLESQAQEW